MKKIFQLGFSLAFFAFGFSQELKPIAEKVKNVQLKNKSFVKYDLFTTDRSPQKQDLYKSAAEGVTVMNLNKLEIKRVTNERPETMEMTFPFEGKNITVELVKNNIFTSDFKVNTDKGSVNYTPGVYYQGIVKGDEESLVAISFFNNDVVGVTSIKDVGNIILGKAKNSEDFVSYNDHKLKGENPFKCASDEIEENKLPVIKYDPAMLTTKKTDNCVRIYYEVCNQPYKDNGSNVTTTTNWLTAVHNNIGTLYNNDAITVALSEIYIWTTADPYTGTYSQNLAAFRTNRPTFNGDLAHLVNSPATTSVAYVNSLCTTSKHAYSGISLSYSNVPVYSWTIMAMTHEMGHSLGSPHTHACAWNGNSTAIDGCGPSAGYSEGCNAPLPTNGGTIMSYCHLVPSVKIDFLNGFGPQPAALIRNTVNSKGCLGTNCTTSCAVTVTGMNITNVTNNSATATIVDNTSTSWKYRLSKMDGTVVTSGNTNNKVINFTNLTDGTYYKIAVGTDCSGPQAFAFEQLLLTDANWCSGTLFTDTGGATGNYQDGQNFVKTFYPANPSDKLKLTFTQFDTEAGYDFMNVYDGPSIASPRFANGSSLSGTTIPGPFQSTHSTGAITVRFTSDAGLTGAGWVASFNCITLATAESTIGNSVSVTKVSKDIFKILSKEKILSYQMFDTSGKLVKNSGKISSYEEKVDLAGYPLGTYVVSIVTTKETITKKVIR